MTVIDTPHSKVISDLVEYAGGDYGDKRNIGHIHTYDEKQTTLQTQTLEDPPPHKQSSTINAQTSCKHHIYTLIHTLIPQPNIFLLYQHGSQSQTNSLT